jgi:thioredoxin 1
MSDSLWVTDATAETFEQAVIERSAEVPVVVDFWAEWCGPCKQMAPHIEAVAGELDGQVKIVKLNVDDFPLVGATYGVRGLPTMLIFKGGKVTATRNGAMNRQALTDWINQSL